MESTEDQFLKESLKADLLKIDWPVEVEYGSVKIQIRAGKPVFVVIEKTIQLD